MQMVWPSGYKEYFFPAGSRLVSILPAASSLSSVEPEVIGFEGMSPESFIGLPSSNQFQKIRPKLFSKNILNPVNVSLKALHHNHQ